MTQLDELRLINDSNISYLKKINRDYRRNEIIKNILNDDACFFKMKKNDALLILRDIGISDEDIDEIYQRLIAVNEFNRLYKCNKINEKDKELLIKYPNYDTDELFKNIKCETRSNNKKENNRITQYKETFIKRIVKKIKKVLNIK